MKNSGLSWNYNVQKILLPITQLLIYDCVQNCNKQMKCVNLVKETLMKWSKK